MYIASGHGTRTDIEHATVRDSSGLRANRAGTWCDRSGRIGRGDGGCHRPAWLSRREAGPRTKPPTPNVLREPWARLGTSWRCGAERVRIGHLPIVVGRIGVAIVVGVAQAAGGLLRSASRARPARVVVPGPLYRLEQCVDFGRHAPPWQA